MMSFIILLSTGIQLLDIEERLASSEKAFLSVSTARAWRLAPRFPGIKEKNRGFNSSFSGPVCCGSRRISYIMLFLIPSRERERGRARGGRICAEIRSAV